MGSTSPSSFSSTTTEVAGCSSAAADGKTKISAETQRAQRKPSCAGGNDFGNENTEPESARRGINAHLHGASNFGDARGVASLRCSSAQVLERVPLRRGRGQIFSGRDKPWRAGCGPKRSRGLREKP